MQAGGAEALGRGVEVSVDDIGREHVLGVGVRVAEEVGERDGGEGVVVAEGTFVEFYHCEVCFGAVGIIAGDTLRAGGLLDEVWVDRLVWG